MFERGTIHDLLGDLVVYRNLEPMDWRLQGLRSIWSEVGLDAYYIPRKAEPAYAAVVLHLLRQAQALRSNEPLRRLIYIGDTRMNHRQPQCIPACERLHRRREAGGTRERGGEQGGDIYQPLGSAGGLR